MVATVYLVSWNSGAVRALLLLVAAVCMVAAGLALFAAMSALCVACTPMVVGCCTATVGAMPEVCVMAGLLAAMWMIRPK